MRGALAVVLGLVMGALGCAEDPVRIVGSCEAADGAQHILHGGEQGPHVGLVDGWTLLSWNEWTTNDYALQLGMWLDAGLSPASGVTVLSGTGLGTGTQWISRDGGLEGLVIGDADASGNDVQVSDLLHWYRWTPPPDGQADRTPIHLELSSSCPSCGRVSLAGAWGPGVQGQIPAINLPSEALGVVTAYPGVCDYDRSGANYSRLHLVRPSEGTADPVLWGEEPCDVSHRSDDLVASVPWPVPLGDGTLGILFRTGIGGGGGGGALRYLVTTVDGEVLSGPRPISGSEIAGLEGGLQPRALPMPNGRILFTERHGNLNRCHRLRLMNEDGSGAKDAPWQLPCMREPDRWRTGTVELVPAPGGALLVWSQHTEVTTFVYEVDDYEEAIFAALITPQGQRGSDVVQVTDEASTPRAANSRAHYNLDVATEDGHAVVAWRDERPTAPGIYARRLQCTLHE
jgi:hypothetical protein